MSSISGISSVTGLKNLQLDDPILLNDAFFQTIIDNVDATLSGVRVRRETPGEGLGFTYEFRNYLPPWQGDMFYTDYLDEYAEVARGITGFISGDAVPWSAPNLDGSGGTFSDQGLLKWIYLQRGYHLGTRANCWQNPLGCTDVIPETILRRYDSRGWMIDLEGNRGITLRGGTMSRFVQPKTLEEYQKKKVPINSSIYPNISSNPWANSRNKLLYYLSVSDAADTTDILSNISVLTTALKYGLEARNGQTGDFVSFSEPNTRIINKDLLDNLKIIGELLVQRVPMIRPDNGTSSQTSTVTWYNVQPQTKYGLNLGGICLFNGPIGQTNDWNNSTGGNTINTWSPQGITAHQGYYLFEGWHNQGVLDYFHTIYGITSDSEVDTAGDKTLVDLFKQGRLLMWKEIFSRVYHTRECRPWFVDWRFFETSSSPYSGRSQRPPGTDQKDLGQFKDDIDTWGYTNNQWLTPLIWATLFAVFLYKYATTNKEKIAAKKVYNLSSEIIAAFILRSIRDQQFKKNEEGSDYNPVGGWLEGRGYAEQSQKDICRFLYCAQKMGDYRFWEMNSNAAEWIDNQWKYFYYTTLPNLLLVNSQSCATNNLDINAWNLHTTESNMFAILCSRHPEPGTTGSAIAEHYRYFAQPYAPLSQLIGYKIWKYSQGVTYAKSLPNWVYIPTEKMMVWHSKIPVPVEQGNFYPNGTLNQTKPFIFSVWTKAHGSYEQKAHKDGGHISVYMGDAPILIETGEVRNYVNDHGDEFIRRNQGVAGHNTMQLGQREPAGWGMEGDVVGYSGTTLEGSFSVNIINQYNRRGLTATSPPPSGPFNGNGSGQVFYTYQIGHCTRSSSWVYDPAQRRADILIEDSVGISGISSGAAPLSQRAYYRYHTGYNKFGVAGHGISTNGYDDIGESLGHGFTYYPKTAGWTTWELAWNTKGVTLYNLNTQWVGTTMTIRGSQPLWVNREIYTSNSFKGSPNRGLCAAQQKHYTVNIGISGSGADPFNLLLETEIVCKAHSS